MPEAARRLSIVPRDVADDITVPRTNIFATPPETNVNVGLGVRSLGDRCFI